MVETDDPLLTTTPFNLRIMKINDFVKDNHIEQVTSQLIYEPSSRVFHPNGLFSEEIFGQIGTEARMFRFGFIELNTKIIVPDLYKNILKLGSIYGEIMAGKTYATWDPKTKNFERYVGDPDDNPDADTGFSFFMKHYPDIVFPTTDSVQRKTTIALLDKYRETGIFTKFLVMPAGLRDIQNDDNGRAVQDDINNLYRMLLVYASSIPEGAESPLYDNIRYNIQAKALEIDEYIDNIMSGKRGYLQGHYTSRRLALGTRNVISAATCDTARPDSPQALRVNETMVGLFQCMKGMQPLVTYGFRTVFTGPIFGDGGSLTIPLVDPKTYGLQYVEITDKERQKFVTSDGISGWTSRFRNTDVRDRPITVYSADKKPYFLALVYDLGDRIYLFRSKKDAQDQIGPSFKAQRLRPLTWVEALYLVTADGCVGRHAFVTRYPVLQDQSSYPSRIHLTTTSPSRVVRVIDALNHGSNMDREYPEYPILGQSYCDTIVPHPSMLKGLGADFDGDTCSFNIVMSNEANAEIAKYLNSPRSLINTQRQFVSGGMTDLIEWMMQVMTK